MKYKTTYKLLFALLSLFAFNAHAQQVVVDENFDQFTEGSEDSPATTDISGYTGKLNKTIGWNGKYVYEAGGKLKVGDGGKLRTNYLKNLTQAQNVNKVPFDVYAASSTIKVTFDVKSPAEYGGACNVKMGYGQTETLTMNDNGWHTFSVIFERASSTSTVEFEPFLASDGLLFDNVKIEAGDFMKAPVAKQPKTATKTQFTAEWERVSSAESYLLDVYTKTGDVKEYLLQDKEVAETSFEVTGLDESKTYYYNVRAKKGDVVSDPSNEIEVVEVFNYVLAPKALPATNVTAEGFTANWEASENASKYDVIVTRHETVDSEKEVNLIEDDFSTVTEGTLQSPEYEFSYSLDGYTKSEGWTTDGTNACLAAGHIGIALFSGGEGFIQTPKLDLSHAGGAFTVKSNLSEYEYGELSSGGTVEMNLYNGETLAETQTATLEGAAKDYTFQFTKGTAESYVRITYKLANGENKKLFIDDFAVSQTLAKGESYSSFYARNEVGNVTSADIKAPLSSAVSYSYAVMAYARSVDMGELSWVTSALSDEIQVTLAEDKPQHEGVTINPAEGSVNSLKDFELTFDNYQFVDFAVDDYAGPAKLINNDTKEEIIATVDYGTSLNKIDITLPEEVTEEGSYTLHIPSGKLYDGMDLDETDLPEYNFSYTIDGSVEPPVEEPENVVADPKSGSIVGKLNEIVLTFYYDGSVYPTDTELSVTDDATGQAVATIEASTNNLEPNQIRLTLSNEITADGDYTIKCPKGAFVKGELAKAEKSNPFELHYTVDSASAISGATANGEAKETLRVNIGGQKVGKNSKGMTIIRYEDGSTKKVIVR